MEIGTQRILIVDDEAPSRRLVEMALRAPGRTFLEAGDGAEALDIAFSVRPDLIILDYDMPVKNGIEVARDLRSHAFTAHVPVIMVSGVEDRETRLAMIRAGVDDSVRKPYDPEELAARVDMALARAARDLQTDPLTRLPGNVATRAELGRRIDARKPFSLCYTDIDTFKGYVDYYGYERASHVIEAFARVIREAVDEAGVGGEFVGHIGGDDFVVIAAPEQARAIGAKCIERFEALVPDFYAEEDRQRGHIVAHDREGREREFGPLTLSVVIVPNSACPLNSPHELADFVARYKARAKRIPGSTIVECTEAAAQ
jgi:diguanylate cyclase (GGDEF)-like protein